MKSVLRRCRGATNGAPHTLRGVAGGVGAEVAGVEDREVPVEVVATWHTGRDLELDDLLVGDVLEVLASARRLLPWATTKTVSPA